MRVDPKGIGERLLQFRKSISFSQKQMAEQAEIDRSYIAHVENGSTPSSEFIIKLINAFNISIDWLLTGNGKMLLPEDEHVFNKLKEDHVKLLERLIILPEQKQNELIKVFTKIIEIE
ncbi:XRE family transcriptional regulator [Leptospira selangorensis]|uniref:XRE family transcriptional regulator n=1 Tax=Leptospira selangorensis TaxID=2484982 RepID=A0A5F2C6C2_9LEPT|nr:helix-turn-helix transcriptional regulator [Leptospira selangorensis]TGM10270.1 XRE family transcriptional regulator [Leptospira selangorensis]TGM27931.1 XRE family transcriptional regulator [Leptospira selangorensis]